MRYAVNLYAVVRVKISGVEADSPEAAVKLASEVNLGRVLENTAPLIDQDLPGDMRVDYVVDAEDRLKGAVVDPILPSGEVDYGNTVNFEEEVIAEMVDSKKAR